MIPLNHKIEVSLLDFIKTGKFEYLKLGMSRQEVLNIFPEPEGWGLYGDKDVYSASIWFYGNFELHFLKERLWAIHSDTIDNLDGGKYLLIDTWIFQKNKIPDLPKVLRALNKEKIDYKKSTNNINLIEIEIIPSGVRLLFDFYGKYDGNVDLKEYDFNKHRLAAIGKNLDHNE